MLEGKNKFEERNRMKSIEQDIYDIEQDIEKKKKMRQIEKPNSYLTSKKIWKKLRRRLSFTKWLVATLSF